MNLSNWLIYLESMPSILPRGNLDFLKHVAIKMDLLKIERKVITITGTNGKGSTIAFLESILLNYGYKVGVFTSPHILKYNERIRINGKNIDSNNLKTAFKIVNDNTTYGNINYFEFSTLVALFIFKKYKCNVLLLEVGIGGRLDPVNIVDSDLAVITSIDIDHVKMLGNTKEKIGYEKAGIMRFKKYAVCGENMPNTVLNIAKNLNVTLYKFQNDFFAIDNGKTWNFYSHINFKNLIKPSLYINNAAIAIQSFITLFPNQKIKLININKVLKKTFLIGRFHKLKFAGKNIILDVAHNPAAMKLLAFNLSLCKNSGRMLAVTSMLKDKDINTSFSYLVNIIDVWYLSLLDCKRSANKIQLSEAMNKNLINNFYMFQNIKHAFMHAIKECKKEDKVVVFGSFYVISACLKIIRYGE